MSVAPKNDDRPAPEPEPRPAPDPTPDNEYVLEEPKPDSVPSQGETTGAQTTKP